jgi:hypothetical protein
MSRGISAGQPKSQRELKLFAAAKRQEEPRKKQESHAEKMQSKTEKKVKYPTSVESPIFATLLFSVFTLREPYLLACMPLD